MSQELIYTSAPRGLAPGSQGFCTVACTRGMSPNLIRQLESLSGYRQLYQFHDPNAALNPVAFSHLMLTVAGRRCHVLSRVCDAGADYSQRSNKFAHHIVLDAAELPAGGPAWLLSRDGFLRSRWDAEPCLLPMGPSIPSGDSSPRVCRAWRQLVGDAGWAGALAETAAKTPGRQAVLIYRPGTDMLTLLEEALALLPAELRWNVSLSTYFTKLPPGVSCQWRCVADRTPEAADIRRKPPAGLVLDLCRPMGLADGGSYIDMARTGRMPSPVQPSPRPMGDAQGIGAGYMLSSVQAGMNQAADIVITPDATADDYSLQPSPSASVVPPPYPHRFQPKPLNRWLWILSIVASLLLLVTGGLVGWILANRGQLTKLGHEQQVAKKPNSPARDPSPPSPSAKGDPNSPDRQTSTPPPKTPTTVITTQVTTVQQPQPPGDTAPKHDVEPGKGNNLLPESPNKAEDPTKLATSAKKGEEADAPPKPALEFPKYVQIPEYKINEMSLPPERSGGKTLCNLLNIALAEDISLDLFSDAVFPSEYSVKLVKRKATKATWHLLLSQQPLGPKDILIAQFQIDNQDLQFKWEDCDKIARSVELNLLQNCLLKVRLGNQEPIFIPLRKPVLRMPFLFKSLTAPNDFQISYPEHKGKENKGNLEVCHLPEKPTIELRDVSIRKLTESENIEIDRLSDSSYEISVG
ncbi:MAG: hypothetical protein GX594_10075, partial [Pirellulaceae bacterium]|nr:hypothetical protein [Pirellulaceae bacterium]